MKWRKKGKYIYIYIYICIYIFIHTYEKERWRQKKQTEGYREGEGDLLSLRRSHGKATHKARVTKELLRTFLPSRHSKRRGKDNFSEGAKLLRSSSVPFPKL